MVAWVKDVRGQAVDPSDYRHQRPEFITYFPSHRPVKIPKNLKYFATRNCCTLFANLARYVEVADLSPKDFDVTKPVNTSSDAYGADPEFEKTASV